MANEKQQKRRRPERAAVADEAKPETHQSRKQPVAATTGEEDFPRGGAGALTALERRELTEAAKLEVERELAEGKQPKSKKLKPSKKSEQEADDTFYGQQTDGLEGKVAKHVELLRLKSLAPGTKVWGMVLEVTPRGLVVSLAHGLRGHVVPERPGDVAEAEVLEVKAGEGDAAAAGGAAACYVCRLAVAGGGSVRARLEAAHLSDHPAAVEALREAVRPGSKLGRVLVLERLDAQRCVRISRKPALLAAAASAGGGSLPRSFDQVAEGALLAGYVASATPDAVYVRFLGGLTGRAGLPQLSDVFVSNPRSLFTEGQTVRCVVATVDAARQRFTLLLRPSATASSDGAYLLGYFRELAFAQSLRAEAEGGGAGGDADPAALFPPGGLAGATVHEVREYGIVCDMDEHPDVVGLVPSSHVGPVGQSPALGTKLRGRVLDVVGHQGLVELSLKPELVAAAEGAAAKAAKAAAKKLKAGASVEAVVEGIRPGEYLILSLPTHGSALAYAALTDYNTPRADQVPRTFELGQKLTATVAVMPPEAPAGRILCYVPLTRSAAAAGGGGAKERGPKVDLTPGSVIEAVITGIQPHQLDVSIGGGKAVGRIHVTEVQDVDQTVQAVVLGRLQGADGHRRGALDLSLRPGRLAIAKKGEPQVPPVSLGDLVPGEQLLCYVLEAAEDALWLAAGPAVRGRCGALDATLEPSVAASLHAAFPPGKPVVARVLAVSARKHTLDLSLVDAGSGTTHGSAPGAAAPPEGALVLGRVVGAGGGGVRVSLGAGRPGKVALTDIHDGWVPDALAGVAEGDYVRARVLGRDGEVTVLSLRASRGGALARPRPGAADGAALVAAGKGAAAKKGGQKEAAAAAAAAVEEAPELLDGSELAEGSTLRGYVKRCDAKGLFVALDRYRDGRIKLGNLSDGFIADPAAAFPPGMRLEARLLKKSDDGRLELTLRSSTRSSGPSATAADASLAELRVGQLLDGRVRRVEKYGVFVDLGGSGGGGPVGLAHISELADGPVKDIHAAFKAKQAVRCVVTKIDLEAGRLSLSLKPSAVKEAEAAEGAEGGKGRGPKRRRGTDIDDEMAEAAEAEGQDGSEDEEEDGDEASGSEGEGEEEEEEEEEGGKAGSLDPDVAVDDVDVSDAEEDEEEEGSDLEMADEDGDDDDEEEGEEEEEEEEAEGDGADGAAAALTRSRPGTTSTGDLDLSAPWGELLLADDPRVGQAAAGTGPADGADGEGAGKLSKGQKKRLKEQREKEIREAELARLSGSSAPTSVADYERLLLASPNSSFVWIKLMAMHISLGDVEAARKTAQRALSTIYYREEGEKFNVWVAWLNLETAYGTQPSPDEAAMALLRRALQATDPKKMYLAALGIFERADRAELAEQVMRALTKKFGGSAKVWATAIERALQKGDPESARTLLERSLQSLPARKHVRALLRAALAEFRLGSAERGRGVLEGLLRNYPKRLDLWNVYIDQELKTGEQPRIRALFERATHLHLPPKKMKFLFRRYLDYEKSEGDAAAVEHVKKRAMEWVESSLKA
ncbi:hypothetical protein GPECTOR_1g407 [Gonium pectorale]|uniref:S1 motif domain-containing protein n=1 Tax=Gonium pectorale TaxID=33097 RepID=A0A150H343_GONPE|nr:hypothetical protein GPECTOR_1g407 [Gonium pectorale]|eukprot:KXZ56455.1 hypothetical protein GPECTOR_1g407 [Gonium pectorale]